MWMLSIWFSKIYGLLVGSFSGIDWPVGSLYASVKDAEDMLRDLEDMPLQVVKRIYELDDLNDAVEDSKRGGKIVIEFVKEDLED